jgi:hypothetical protein
MAVLAAAQLLDAKWGFKELSRHDVLLRTPRLCKVLAHDRCRQTLESKPGFHPLITALSIKLDFALNRPVEDWGKLLGDVAAVSAMLDRLLHHGHVLKCGPRSWRTKAAGTASSQGSNG